MIQGHGSDQYKYREKVLADFSSNVWYDGPPEQLKRHLLDQLSGIVQYPEPDAGSLRQKIAAHHQVAKEQVIVTNGATETFYHVAGYYKGASSAILYPSFAEYEDACRRYDHKLHFYQWATPATDPSFNTSFIWLGRPNNPDGSLIDAGKLRRWVMRDQQSIFVVDEAFIELSGSGRSIISEMPLPENMFVVRSLTKQFAIPGIRLGYLVVPPAIGKALYQSTIPWQVNSLAQEAGHCIFDHYAELRPDSQRVGEESRIFREQLEQIKGMEVMPSACNFFLVKLHKGSSKALKDFLLQQHHLLIRDASNFRGLDDRYFRVSVQSEAWNERLIQGIREYLECVATDRQ